MRFKFKLRFPEFQVFLYKAKILLIQIVPALDELNKEGSLINTKAKIGGFDNYAIIKRGKELNYTSCLRISNGGLFNTSRLLNNPIATVKEQTKIKMMGTGSH